MSQRAKLFKAGLISREGERVVLEPAGRRWSQEFLDLAGSAPDFPYPEEPPGGGVARPDYGPRTIQ